MRELSFHLLAMSAMLNFFLMAYAIPKLRRGKDYWKQRSTWYERYTDDLLNGYESLPDRGKPAPPGTDAPVRP
jgi:hypothetical protein